MSLYSILFCHVALDLCSQYIRDQLSACATCDGRRYTHSYQFSSTVLDAGSSTVHGFQNAQSRLHSSSGFLHASDTKRRGLQPMLCCVVFIQHCSACRNGVHPRLRGMSPLHAARIHGVASLAGFWSCCHFHTTAADSCAGSFGPGRCSSEDVAAESVYAGMKPTLYMRWSSASERPSTQAGATTPLPWKAIVIAIGLWTEKPMKLASEI